MSRIARKRSCTGIYHIMLRGNNKQEIFENDGDVKIFLRMLAETKKAMPFRLHACCFMGNHIHLLVAENPYGPSVSDFMRIITSQYVMWYNKHYNRVGNLFQDRFLSEPVEDIVYYKTVFRYIHQNPVKGGLENKMGQYRWSSYGIYLMLDSCRNSLYDGTFFDYVKDWNYDGENIIDHDFPIMAFENISLLIDFCGQTSDDLCMDVDYIGSRELKDCRARQVIADVCHCQTVSEFQGLSRSDKRVYVKLLLEHGLTKAQIRRLCGVSAYMIDTEASKIKM